MAEISLATFDRVIQVSKRFLLAREAIIFFIAIGLFVLFSVVSGGTFASSRSIDILAVSASELGIIALGVAVLMLAGEFDLSVGSISAVGALTVAALYQLGLNPFLAIFVAIGGGTFAAAINGLITVRFGIPSLIVTLGTMMMWRGVVFVITNATHVSFPIAKGSPTFYNFLQGAWGVGSAPLIWFAVISIFLILLIHFHRFGNHVFATGGNKDAARAMGINVNRVKIICFMIVGALAAFSGVMRVTRIGGFQVGQGEGIEFMVIAAVVIGGTSLFGGSGSIIGAVLGVLIITFLEYGLVMSRVAGFWYNVILGILIVAVVTINRILEQRRKIA